MKLLQLVAKDYSEASSIHGIAYIFRGASSSLEKLIWLIIVGIGLFFCIFISESALEQWKTKRIMTTLETTALPIEEVNFPAITICAQVGLIGNPNQNHLESPLDGTNIDKENSRA